MGLSRFIPLLALLVTTMTVAAPPQLYRDVAHESPVRGAPDDLLLIAGAGLAADDTVVYRAVTVAATPSPPRGIPRESDANAGVAVVVSSKDVPTSLTIKLPQVMEPEQTYALWVHTARGEWSKPITINDVRPLWITPVFVYASAALASLPRELKIVGRNLQPSSGRATQIRLRGPQDIMGSAIADKSSSEVVNQYVARLRLPQHIMPGLYHVMVNRDGVSWVELKDQLLRVYADPPAAREFSVTDPQFGQCRANDGEDDTPCILRAISAANDAGGGTVHFGPGTWDLVGGPRAVISNEGIIVPPGVNLRGEGPAVTLLERHAEWNTHAATAAFTLIGHNLVSGFTFRDRQRYVPGDEGAPFLRLGEDWQRALAPGASELTATVTEVTITGNIFDKPFIAIGVGGRPIERLFLTYNVFGAYHADLELAGDQFNLTQKYRMDDSIIDFNVFKPGSELDLIRKTGTIASETGAGFRVDFSGNNADGSSMDYLYSPEDAKGWRATFFWSTHNNMEEMLVSQNIATCTGDKIGDGEAIAFDSNANTFGFADLPRVSSAGPEHVDVIEELVTRQHNRDVPGNYYVGHWVQVISGPGLGQVRKVVGYSINPATHHTIIKVMPNWDVVPVAGSTRIAIGLEYWQLFVLDNRVDNRMPLCQKSNRSRHVGGTIGLWAQTADSVIAGNHQYDSDGIFAQQNYGFVTQNYEASEVPCAGCTMMGFFNFFLDIRDNVIDGEYDWANDCSRSGIGAGVAAASWAGEGPPPTVSFGVSIAHNSIRHADEQYGGAIALVNTWSAGPEPYRWPLADNVLIHHNVIQDIDGPRALPICGTSRPRIGIAFPDSEIAWRTVLYANSCKNVSMPIGPGGIGTVMVCPSSAPDSCECPPHTK